MLRPRDLLLGLGLSVFPLVGCSDGGGNANNPDLAVTDPCAPYASRVGEACVSSLSYNAGPSLPTGRDHHGTAIAETSQGAFLYVTGGTNYTGIFSDVQVAPIAADGSLGPFKALPSMPHTRAGHGIVVHGGRLYVVGGRAAGFLNSTISAPINDDGSLGAWADEPNLPTAHFHLAAVASTTRLYAIGGVSGDASTLPYVASTDVYAAPFLADGHLGPWQTLTSLTQPRSHHAAAIHDDTLYLMGGLMKDTAEGSPVGKDIIAAKIQADGSLSAFTQVGELGKGVAAMASFVANSNLYIVGGLDEHDGYDGTVSSAPILADGKLGAVTTHEPLPTGRSHVHQTPYYKGHMYTMGGSVDLQVVTDEVWVADFSPNQRLSAIRPIGAAPTYHAGKRCACAHMRISIPR